MAVSASRFDRGLKFLYVQSLPVSQFYRVAVDNAQPYNIYGGLQDNGCWIGPSAVWTAERHPQRALVAPLRRRRLLLGSRSGESRHVFSASQFLGLQRNDTRTWTAQEIGPAIRRARSPIAATGTLGQERAAAGARQRDGTTPTGMRRSCSRPSTRRRSTPAASTCSARAIAAPRGKTLAT